MRAGIYARISLDASGDAAGVDRQLADCRALAKRKGWKVTAEYVDNSVSALRAKHRPAFEELLTALERHEIDAVLAWHPDRLYRRLSDLERLADVLRSADVEVATVGAGDLDLSTSTGRMIANILGSIARGESEHMGERVSRAKKALADQGRPAGGGKRPFGYLDDRITLHPTEAPLLATAAAHVAAGGTFGTAVAQLTEQGSVTTWGRPWTTGALRRTLTAPRYAGLRSYKGEIVGEAVWPAIIDRDTWERIRHGVHIRKRGGRPATAPYLLRGVLECGKCGARLYGRRVEGGRLVYSCTVNPRTEGKGCGGCAISAGPLEEIVREAARNAIASAGRAFVTGWLQHEGSDGADVVRARLTIEDCEARMVGLAERWAAGDLGDREYDAARAVLAGRRTEAELVLAGAPTPLLRGDTPTATDLLAVLDDPDAHVEELRGVICAVLVTPIRVGSGWGSTGRVPPVDRVRLAARWA